MPIYEETRIQKEILEALDKVPQTRMYRNVTGRFKSLSGGGIITAGIVGSPDLLGYTFHEVTALDLGKRLPVFTGIEVKTAKGRLKPHQRDFIKRMADDRCIVGVARCVDDALHIIGGLP